jgi:hypothetical protein
LAVFLVALACLLLFFSIDACMDAGGVWSNWGLTCHGAYPEFVPQYQRPLPLFWGFVVVLASIPTLLIYKVLPNAAR